MELASQNSKTLVLVTKLALVQKIHVSPVCSISTYNMKYYLEFLNKRVISEQPTTWKTAENVLQILLVQDLSLPQILALGSSFACSIVVLLNFPLLIPVIGLQEINMIS